MRGTPVLYRVKRPNTRRSRWYASDPKYPVQSLYILRVGDFRPDTAYREGNNTADAGVCPPEDDHRMNINEFVCYGRSKFAIVSF